jgi:hypothetical protein
VRPTATTTKKEDDRWVVDSSSTVRQQQQQQPAGIKKWGRVDRSTQILLANPPWSRNGVHANDSKGLIKRGGSIHFACSAQHGE